MDFLTVVIFFTTTLKPLTFEDLSIVLNRLSTLLSVPASLLDYVYGAPQA